jgi:hypothetical protein
MEGEMVDSITNKQLAAAIQWGEWRPRESRKIDRRGASERQGRPTITRGFILSEDNHIEQSVLVTTTRIPHNFYRSL